MENGRLRLWPAPCDRTRCTAARAGEACARAFPQWRERLGPDHLLPLDVLRAIGGSALTDAVEIQMGANGLPTTFVPGRNLMFFTAAAALAFRRGIRNLVGGMCETDFSGYPDCRDATIKATGAGTRPRHGHAFRAADAADVARQGGHLGAGRNAGRPALVDLIVEETVTCYAGDRSAAPCLGLWLRRLPGLRSAREGLCEATRRA